MSSGNYIGGLWLDRTFDGDGELAIGDSYLIREQVVELRDHLNSLLSENPTTNDDATSVADALLDVAAAIRSLSATEVKPTHSPTLTGSFGAGAGIPTRPDTAAVEPVTPTTMVERIKAGDKPEQDDPRDAWNAAALDLAYKQDRCVAFDYKRALYSSVSDRHGKVMPLGTVEGTGPKHDPYKAVLCRDYRPDGECVLKTFRLDRINGYIELLPE